MNLVFTACSNDDNPSSDSSGGKEYTGIPLIILDTDIGSFTDDLFAMQMLYRYADEGKCKFLGVVVDRQGEDYAALADVMNTYFGYPDLPIKQVYLNYNCNTGQKMWDPMAVINAVEGDELFNFSPWGVVTFHPDAMYSHGDWHLGMGASSPKMRIEKRKSVAASVSSCLEC